MIFSEFDYYEIIEKHKNGIEKTKSQYDIDGALRQVTERNDMDEILYEKTYYRRVSFANIPSTLTVLSHIYVCSREPFITRTVE